MKPLMKVVFVNAILFLMVSSAAAVTLHQEGFSNFTDASGNVGLVEVDRSTDAVTLITTTTLAYSFCVQSTVDPCLEGGGVIPNTAFVGNLNSNVYRAQAMKVSFDTTTGGFKNILCSGSDRFGNCTTETPATGGLVSVTFVTQAGSAEVFTENTFIVQKFKVVNNYTTQDSDGSASIQGTVIGTSIRNNNATWDVFTAKGNNGSVVLHRKSQTPAIQRRLERLTGRSSDNK